MKNLFELILIPLDRNCVNCGAGEGGRTNCERFKEREN